MRSLPFALGVALAGCSYPDIAFTRDTGAAVDSSLAEVSDEAGVDGAPDAIDAKPSDIAPESSSTCGNGKKDGDETDVDCGGSCGKCSNGKTCALDTDCVTKHCTVASCADCPVAMSSVPSPSGGHYCVDKTEVTNQQYADFLAASPSTTALPAECSWKTSFVPAAWPAAPTRVNYPVANVDWCDAWRYCRAYGKRLCGRVGGGAVKTADVGSSDTDEFTRACNNAGKTVYPYVGAYQPAGCNGTDTGLHDTVSVATYVPCRSEYDIYDLSGNVSEWENACDPAGDAGPASSDLCILHGGDMYSNQYFLQCDHTFALTRDIRNEKFGFRCCGD